MPDNIENVRVEALNSLHERGAFLCTSRPIQNFCRYQLEDAHYEYRLRAFVAVEPPSRSVLGYYYLCLSTVAPDEAGPGASDQFLHVDALPSVYLGMLGVHQDHARQGVGTLLMRDAFSRVLQIAEHAGVYACTLDAVDEGAARYYEEKFEFERFAEGSLKMYLLLSDIRGAIPDPEPEEEAAVAPAEA